MTNYIPSNKYKQEFIKAKNKNRVQYKRINLSLDNRHKIYKYLSLDTVLSIFKKASSRKRRKFVCKRNPPQTLRFVEPIYWDDKYERRFYAADYSKVPGYSDNTPRVYATCFTTRAESEPAWAIYGRDEKKCVQFCFNKIALRTQLVKNLKNCTIIEGPVRYITNYDLNTLHLSDNKDGSHNSLYDKYFSSFSLDNYINLLLLKRTAFEHEREIRIFIIENNKELPSKTKKEAKHKDVSLDWLLMLEGIKVDHRCTDNKIRLLQNYINNLIASSKKIKHNKKKELREKLIIKRYNVYDDIECNCDLPIGETYDQFEKRLLQLHSNDKCEKPKRRQKHYYRGKIWHREHRTVRKRRT